MKNYINVLLFFSLLFICFLHISFSQSIIQTLTLPNTTYWNTAYGIAADSTALYISSTTSTTTLFNYGRIYKLDHNGQVLDSVTSTTTTFGQSQGLAYDGTNFYYVRRYTSSCTVIKTTPAGVIIDSMRIGSSRYVGDAAWGGSHLWVTLYSPNPGRVLKIDWGTKTVVDSIWTIGDQPTGVAWDGQYIYYAMDIFSSEPNLNLIYVVDPISKDTVRTITMPESRTTDSNPRGLAYDGNYLWLIARPVGGGTGQRIYKYDIKGGGNPAINIPTKFYDNGWVNLGDSIEVTGTIQNTGTATLIIDSVKSLYSLNYSHTLAVPTNIPSGSSHNFKIKFKPVFYGVDSAQIVLYHNDITRPAQTIRLTGKGRYPDAFIEAPSSYTFGLRRVNSTSTWKIKIENRGAQPLIITTASFALPDFYVEPGILPMTINPVSSKNLRVWFFPKSTSANSDTLTLNTNARNTPIRKISFTGQGDVTPLAIGVPFWNYTVVDHPISNTSRTVKGVRAFNDITGDGKRDVIISTENYWTMAVNGNSSVDNDSLWAFTTYISSNSAGSIGTAGDYSYQKALAIASDLNGDGFNDVVIGTGGGNETVYALNGKNGAMLWKYGTDEPGQYNLGDFTGVDVSKDFNNDGIPDVIAASAATETGGLGGRRSIYLFNGATGDSIWKAPLLGFTHAVAAIKDIDNDSIPDVIGTVGAASYKASAFSGVNGNLIWNFALPSASGGGKEVMILPVSSTQEDVILGAFWGPVYRVNSVTGTQVWSTPMGNKGVLQFGRLRDITNDGIDEIVVATLGGGAMCLNGATGAVIWTTPTGNSMGIAVISDLNGDGFDDVIIASQTLGTYIVKGNDGSLLYQHTFGGSIQTREVAIVTDLDGNNSFEILAGSNLGHVVLLSGGLDAPVGIKNDIIEFSDYLLMQNYPNPFNPFTTIRYFIPELSRVSVKVFNTLGQEIKTLIDEVQSNGIKSIGWNATNSHEAYVAGGTYFYRIEATSLIDNSNVFTQTRKMILLW